MKIDKSISRIVIGSFEIIKYYNSNSMRWEKPKSLNKTINHKTPAVTFNKVSENQTNQLKDKG